MPDDFQSVVMVLKMGTKYNIQCLRERAIEVLGGAFPTEQEDMDNFETVQKWRKDDDEFDLGTALSVVALARNLNIPALLPLAMLLCCFSPDENIIKKLVASDVPQIDQLRIISGKMRLREIHVDFLRDILREGSDLCKSPAGKCAIARFNTTYSADYEDLPDFSADSGSVAAGWKTRDPNGGTICHNCKPRITERYIDMAEGHWEDLPEYFGLPSWAALKNPGETSKG